MHKNQGAGAYNPSGTLIGVNFLVQLFVRSHISGCGFEVYPAVSFAADQILTGAGDIFS